MIIRRTEIDYRDGYKTYYKIDKDYEIHWVEKTRVTW